MADLLPDFIDDFPVGFTLDQFAEVIFTLANPATFSIDANDNIEDSHGVNQMQRRLLDKFFTSDAINNGRVGYHFIQDYKCNNISILNCTISRRFWPTVPLMPIPQLRKRH